MRLRVKYQNIRKHRAINEAFLLYFLGLFQNFKENSFIEKKV